MLCGNTFYVSIGYGYYVQNLDGGGISWESGKRYDGIALGGPSHSVIFLGSMERNIVNSKDQQHPLLTFFLSPSSFGFPFPLFPLFIIKL